MPLWLSILATNQHVMIPRKDFSKECHKVIEWIDEYFRQLEDLPVKSPVRPGEIKNALGHMESDGPDSLSEILKDVSDIILPGMTHWQHPNFHAYFPANSSMESLFAEFITAALGAQCMIWETSPSAAELEEYVLDWLKPHLGIPEDWEGVIQDTASTATLAAILTAREVATDFQSNHEGVPAGMRVYGSTETHSSIEKAVGVAGIGRRNLVAVGVREDGGMDPESLREAVEKDIQSGLRPFCVIATMGTTGTVAIDPLPKIAEVCELHKLWLHVDAAYAGSALLLPEYRWMAEGLEKAQSFVFNPHKWLFTNFDCSLYYVRNADALIRTFEILPEYLNTSTRGSVNDYRDWGIPLGRRFRSLKLWFVLRGMGMEEIRSIMRRHIELAGDLAEQIDAVEGLKVVSGPFLNFFAFRTDISESEETNDVLTKSLLERLNASGVLFASHTRHLERYVIRFVVGQTYVEKKHTERALSAIKAEWSRIRVLI